MSGAAWWVATVPCSDSFRTACAELVAELGGSVLAWDGEGALPPGAAAVLVLAGGAEPEGLERLAGLPPVNGAPRFLVGAASDHRLAAGALQRGAADYFALPDDLELLRRTLERAAREAGRAAEAERWAEDERRTSGFAAIIGRSPALRKALDHGERVARHRDVSVLLGGETGTGKELLARAIHYHSPRAAGPFVEVNCAAIPANLIESELFGHERGAFTGAVAAKPGLFELADGGTLFLDEVGHLPLELQAKILRALESREIRRVGGQAAKRVDVRVVAATHVDLPAAVRRGEFREDLFYRLNVVAIALPPLREREGDVEVLADAFANRLAAQYGLPVPALSPEVRAALRRHRWPGNVRELRNAVERALVLSPPGTIDPGELRLEAGEVPGDGRLPFPADLATIARAAARAMLEETGGNKSEAARRLGISRPRLLRLLEGGDDE